MPHHLGDSRQHAHGRHLFLDFRICTPDYTIAQASGLEAIQKTKSKPWHAFAKNMPVSPPSKP
jgi:hypothetical protein